MLVLCYEDMHQDLAMHIRRLGAFLGKDLSPHAVAAIADYASFASMSVNPFTNRAGNPLMDFSIARFLRKGVVGDWSNHFTADYGEVAGASLIVSGKRAQQYLSNCPGRWPGDTPFDAGG